MKNKIFTTLLLVIYFTTSLLPVHAFAMHSTHDTNDHHQEITENCGHPQSDHDHNSHSKDNSEHTDMSECIDQWKWTVIDDTVVFSQHDYIPYILPPIKYNEDIVYNDLYKYSLHDPWRWDNASFAKFIMSHYWETILHC
jgi:hypothetical protein